MGDIINIGVRFNTSEMKQAEVQMDKVVASGKRMETQVSKVEAASQRMNKRVQESQEGIRELSNAAGVLTGPLGGVSGRLSAFGRLLGNVRTDMALLTLGLAAFGAAIITLGGNIIDAADKYNTLQARIKQVTQATGDYRGVSRELSGIAKDTGVALENTVDAFQRIQIGAKGLGKSNADVIKLTRAVEELGIMSGTSTQGLNAGLLQFGQSMSAGIVRAEEFNSVVENMPALAGRIADGLGKTIGQLKQLVIAGKLASKDVFDTLIKQAPEIEAQFRAFPVSIERAKNSVKVSFDAMAGEFDKTLGLTKIVSSAFIALANAMDFLAKHTDEVVVSLTALSTILGILAFETVVQQVTKLAEAFNFLGKAAALGEGLATGAQAFGLYRQQIAGALVDLVRIREDGIIKMSLSMGENIAEGMRMGDSYAHLAEKFAQTETAAMRFGRVLGDVTEVAIISTVQGVDRLGAIIVGLIDKIGALTLALLRNPWTWVIAMVVLVAKAFYDLKKSIEATMKTTVTWGDVFKGTIKTVWDHWTSNVNAALKKLDEFNQFLLKTIPFLKELESIGGSVFTFIGDAISYMGKELQKFVENLPLVKYMLAELQNFGKELKYNIQQEAATRSYKELASKYGGNPDEVNTNNNKFMQSKWFQRAQEDAAKKGVTLAELLTGSDKVSDVGGKATPIVTKAKKDSMAQRIANLTKDVNADLAAAQFLLGKRDEGERIYTEAKALKDAENEIRQKNLKLSKAQYNDLVQKVTRTNLLKTDIEIAGDLNKSKYKTSQDEAIATAGNRDQLIRNIRSQDIAGKLESYNGSESRIAQYGETLQKEQDAGIARKIQEANIARTEEIRQQNVLNKALLEGDLAYKNAKVSLDALNQARSTGSDLTDEELKGMIKKNEEAKKSEMSTQLDREIQLRDKAIAQTNALNVATTQGSDAYRIAKQEIDAYNEALANGNTLTDEDIKKLKDRIVQQAEADRQLEITTQRVQGIKQLYTDLGSAFAGAFTDAVTGVTSFRDALKKLMQDLLAILAKKFIFDKIVGFLAGNANGSGKFGTKGLFGTVLGYGAQAASAFSPAAGSILNAATLASKVAGFAKGGVISSPHVFPFASGVGLMGEAGPESIMPLRRLPNGDLGIQAIGGGNGTQINNNVYVTVEGGSGGGKGNGDHDQEMANKISKTISDQLKSMVAEQIKEQMRPGNALNPGTSYR